MSKSAPKSYSPATLALSSYVAAIICGSVLLMLPISTPNEGVSGIDALFTATSAVCVTGLSVLDIGSQFTFFGQVIILLMIQLGGLGIMTYTVLIFTLMGRAVSFRQRKLMHGAFGGMQGKNIRGLITNILVFSFVIELIGAVLLFPLFSESLPVFDALFSAVFHSVSAFCNAGFSLFSDSLTMYRFDAAAILTFSGLIIAGGIGFPVMHDVLLFVRGAGKPRRLSVQTKMVLWSSFVLTVVGAFAFWVGERHTTLQGASSFEALLTCLFQSVTCRTAGFNTVDIASLHSATLFFMLFLMLVGGSPGSCAGGIKTTTVAILAGFAWARMKNERRVTMFRKSIPIDTVGKSVALVTLSISIICFITYLLMLSAPGGPDHLEHRHFLYYIFETISAFGTVGLSMGATSGFNVAGKSLLILLMLIGRVGVFTFAYVLAGETATKGFERAEENVMIG